jgi:hypothetical protein
VADPARIVKPVDAGPDHGSPGLADRGRQLVGERRLSRGADAVDGHADRVIEPEGADGPGYLANEGTAVHVRSVTKGYGRCRPGPTSVRGADL